MQQLRQSRKIREIKTNLNQKLFLFPEGEKKGEGRKKIQKEYATHLPKNQEKRGKRDVST